MHRIFALVLWSALLYSRKFRLIVLLAVVIDARGSMKLIKSKGNVVFRTWRRIQVGYNGAFNEIPEVFSAMGLGVEVSKLHV